MWAIVWVPVWFLLGFTKIMQVSLNVESPYDGHFNHYNPLSHMDKLFLISFELAIMVWAQGY